MKDLFGLFIVAAFCAGVFFVGTIMVSKYEERISICAANNFTYEKCAELYNWEIK